MTKAVKVTLSTKRVVILRQLTVGDTELAAQAVAKRAQGDVALLQLFMQKALLQQLLMQVDDSPVTGIQREDIDGLFSIAEYSQLVKVIAKMNGGEESEKEPQIDFVDLK